MDPLPPSHVIAPAISTPQLTSQPLRELTVEPREDGRMPHLAAASALVPLGSNLVAIADDELHVGVFDAALGATAPGKLLRVWPGTLPDDPDARKAAKPDLEAATRLPAGPGMPNGALLALGSGSKEARRRGFVWELDAAGGFVGAPRTLELGPLYESLSKQVRGKFNVEGAAVSGSDLLLFHRGNTRKGESSIMRLSLEGVWSDLGRGDQLTAAGYRGLTTYDLGSLDGARLHFSDATALPGGEVAFLASAEVTDDPVDDGKVLGSAIGVLDATGGVRELHRMRAGAIKAEGLAWLATTGGAHDLRVVTDADDPERASMLYRVSLPVPART